MQAGNTIGTLRRLAQARRLPEHQYMDRPTLEWITANRPAQAAPCPAAGDTAGRILIPAADWFTGVHRPASIHGVRHNTRVSVLAGLLAREAGLSEEATDVLRVAAAVHDCRRATDIRDAGHGRRAALWLRTNADTVTATFGVVLSPAARHVAAVAIALHDVPYGQFGPGQERDYACAGPLADLLKAADCLDRYRLPLTEWWPDPTLLRVDVPAWLHGYAFDLILRSEHACADGADERDPRVYGGDHAR